MNNGQYVFWQNYVCVQVCAHGTYADYNNFTCYACAGGCLTCDGPTLEDCDTCTTFNGSTYYKDRQSRTCGEEYCPSGQFIKSTIPYICQACEPQCISCSITAKNCNETDGCAEGYYFYSPTNSCLAVCPNGYYADALDTQDCIECADGCKLCYGPGYDACTKC